MCGICGLLFSDPARRVEFGVLAAMNQTILHRGPDSGGTHIDGPLGLAMRRLAIIDLQTGEQPLANEVGSVWIVFNGEIYNHAALRADLVKRGHVFKTASDTEVIVHLYEEHGIECVRQLRGMFAFAIWDARRRHVFLARDRLGKKPLYYAEHDGALIFGSELKCLLAYPGFPRDADVAALHHYLTLQYTPAPQSAFRAARQLPPAHRMVWEDGKMTIDRYWELPFEPKRRATPELREEVRHKIDEAVRLRLIGDVPLGAHLSGGVDSSVVVGLMAQASSQPVRTFSIGFEEETFSEIAYARSVAEKFGTQHQEFIVRPDALDVLPKLVAHFDEPFADPAAIPTWYLAQLTRRHVTVALNGDGADEIFAGYQRHYADPLADLYRLVPRVLRHGIFNRLLTLAKAGGNKPIERDPLMALRQLAQAADHPRGASVVRWGTYFHEGDKRRLYTPDFAHRVGESVTADLLTAAYAAAPAHAALDRVLAVDLQNYLPGALLPKVDRTTMAHSLEARSPFLDHELVELAARLPTSWKVRGMTTKWLLRDLYKDLLPPRLAGRGKMGFSVPLGLWFRGPLRDFLHDMLLAPDTQLHQMMQEKAVRALIDEHLQSRADHGKKLWALLFLELWLRQLRPTF